MKIEHPQGIDLERLVMSDPASSAFVGDAIGILEKNLHEGADVAVSEVLAVVASETDGVGRSGEDTMKAELQDLAVTAKRGALLLLTAAWFAEMESAKL